MTNQVDFLVKLRDAALMIADATSEYIETFAPPEVKLENEAPAVNEAAFTELKWDSQKGAKLGEFDVAHKASNIEDRWQSAFNILKSSNATIKDRYHGTSYSCSYWIYGQDKIYRQRLKQGG